MKGVSSFTIALALLVSTVSVGIPALLPKPAQALCVTAPEDGWWRNKNSSTRSITRVHVDFQCQDQILNGQLHPPFPFYINLFGKCHPTDCDWGVVGANRASNGWIRTTIDHGFARRDVWVKLYENPSGNELRVWIWTDFTDPNRRDYASDDWFRRF
jgi:hypothetical protein